MRSARIIAAGMHTTVQDAGRTGWLRYGLPPGGAMDRAALKTANTLLGNNADAAVLECTGTMPVLECNHAARLSVVYADHFATMEVRAGEAVSLKPIVVGYRAYIAFEGGIDVPLVMGSRSTCLPAKLGGFEGRVLRSGDVLPIAGNASQRHGGYDVEFDQRLGGVVHVIPGPEANWFDCGGLNTFLSEAFRVSAKSDRIGIRLEGKPLTFRSNEQMVSSALGFGTIQVPPAGLPIIMMADHPTCGGYPRIGHVLEEDLSVLAQLRPGDPIRFKEVRL